MSLRVVQTAGNGCEPAWISSQYIFLPQLNSSLFMLAVTQAVCALQVCHAFQGTGSCRYGTRCKYVHDYSVTKFNPGTSQSAHSAPETFASAALPSPTQPAVYLTPVSFDSGLCPQSLPSTQHCDLSQAPLTELPVNIALTSFWPEPDRLDLLQRALTHQSNPDPTLQRICNVEGKHWSAKPLTFPSISAQQLLQMHQQATSAKAPGAVNHPLLHQQGQSITATNLPEPIHQVPQASNTSGSQLAGLLGDYNIWAAPTPLHDLRTSPFGMQTMLTS